MIGRKILLIDNNAEFLQLIGEIFGDAGALVFWAMDGMEGIGKVLSLRPDLIVLGILVAGQDSLHVYKKIRQFSNTPLIMISHLDGKQLALQGWKTGPNNFLVKPATPQNLLVHAKAILRQHNQNSGSVINYDDGRLKIEVLKHRVQIKNKRIKLTPVEFRLLVYLTSNAEEVLTYEKILAHVWGDKQDVNNSNVHVYISHLRSKIEDDPKKPLYIQSIHGVGYIFEKPNVRTPYDKVFGKLVLS